MGRRTRFLIIATTALTLFGTVALASKPPNGGFERNNLSGWKHADTADGKWKTYRGTKVPKFYLEDGEVTRRGKGSPFTKFYKPPKGKYAARTIQHDVSRQVLYRNLKVSRTGKTRLSFLAYYKNAADGFKAPSTLAIVGDDPNQQFRIDILRKTAGKLSTDPGDILRAPFRTESGDPQQMKPTRFKLSLTQFAGKTVRLRFAVVTTASFLMAGVDDVKLKTVGD